MDQYYLLLLWKKGRKIMVKPKNPNLYEDTIKEYQNKTARYSDNLSEL